MLICSHPRTTKPPDQGNSRGFTDIICPTFRHYLPLSPCSEGDPHPPR